MTNRFCTHSSVIWYLFPSLLRNSGNKHQNNPLVSAETVRHSSTYIILYIFVRETTGERWFSSHESVMWKSIPWHDVIMWYTSMGMTSNIQPFNSHPQSYTWTKFNHVRVCKIKDDLPFRICFVGWALSKMIDEISRINAALRDLHQSAL